MAEATQQLDDQSRRIYRLASFPSRSSAPWRRPIGLVKLRGEISNFNGQHSSGHCYFKLKDENAVHRRA